MLFTSEQVSCGHPDKICDQIADAVLTDCLRHDPESRVAIECLIKDNVIVLAGELTSEHMPDTNALAHEVLRRIGVPESESYESAAFITRQSRDIARGVDRGGAGDQGMMYGYATDETPELMPLPFMLATRALLALRDLRSPLLLPDGHVPHQHTASGGRTHCAGKGDCPWHYGTGRRNLWPEHRFQSAGESYWQVCAGRFLCGYRRDGPENHCRYLRLHVPSWRWGFLR